MKMKINFYSPLETVYSTKMEIADTSDSELVSQSRDIWKRYISSGDLISQERFW